MAICNWTLFDRLLARFARKPVPRIISLPSISPSAAQAIEAQRLRLFEASALAAQISRTLERDPTANDSIETMNALRGVIRSAVIALDPVRLRDASRVA